MPAYLPFFLGILPLAVMIVLILKLKTPIHLAVLITLALTLAVTGLYWHTPLQTLGSALIYGALKGLWPIVIVILGAIYSYNLMLKTGSMDILRDVLAAVSDDKRIQVLLIAWCFGGFLEAAAGYGTAVAIPIGILIALGFNPLKAAIASLVANTVPTAFGAVGIPVSILAEQVNLPVTALSGTIISQLALFNILLPFVIVAIIGGGVKALRGVFTLTLLCGISTLIPQYLVAIKLGAELPAFAGSLVSLIVVTLMAKARRGETAAEYRIDGAHLKGNVRYSAPQLLRACAIYLLIFIFILLCSPLFPAIRSTVAQVASVLPFPLANGQVLKLKIDWIATPGVLIIIATLIGGVIQGAALRQMLQVFVDTVKQLKNSIIAISAIVAMATVMDVSGLIATLAQTLVNVTGGGYLFIAPIIGALGTFVTGSDTNSNVLFGKLQTMAAEKLHVDPLWLAAANTSGATGGKMISPQSIAIAVSATRMDGQGSAIMSGTLKYCCAYIVILGLKVGLVYYLFMA
ncbi:MULTISPECIES: L-lactate permease [Edwardsiella]|uniref:L-lactate permease n=2 Tax=Edwardsiella anguillarum TaxID=1821960 RepID=A0A076LPB1_9GAMM|nr:MULTISPECIES: L-lactate permease [Edwardsiella]AKM46137.1 lactate permease [Edwardsiella sp. EA181011]GAJ67159.1 L-lactate permease [Edwardsiella piscicida]AIJ08532.1 L-lactate permease family protein [Edwardsiella anguillarum ET080813]KAB0593014.1 L-lactate permease [Edwardsiella anguillarum]RFT02058.1 L-lactate permease [Edwardsiella anguillarum]